MALDDGENLAQIASAGAVVIAAIVVTRKINPDAKYGSAHLWDRQSALPFSFTAAPWWSDGPEEAPR